jgi:formylglycine-generating enzyme required for sulfatase activity
MIVVPAGHFTMGSPAGEVGRTDWEGPQREVTIAQPFAVGRFPITRGEFAAFVRETKRATGDTCWTFEDNKVAERSSRSFLNPGYNQEDRHPVVCVNWDDAKAFAAWLSKETSKNYRLLSEAEREYATRAGTTTPFSTGLTITTDQANFNGYRQRTLEVGSFGPNPFGIHDMHGNVADWTEDCWHDNYQGAPIDGSAWTSVIGCIGRVFRGGTWGSRPQALRSANRLSWTASRRGNGLGFRLARSLNP